MGVKKKCGCYIKKAFGSALYNEEELPRRGRCGVQNDRCLPLTDVVSGLITLLVTKRQDPD